MRKKNRSFLLMSLISASLLVSVFTIVQAQSPAAPAAAHEHTCGCEPSSRRNPKLTKQFSARGMVLGSPLIGNIGNYSGTSLWVTSELPR